MKKIIVILASICLLVSCKKTTVAPDDYSVYGKNNGGVYFSFFKENTLSTGENTEEKINTHTLIWSAENRDFDVSKLTMSEMLGGYMYDQNSKKSIKTDRVYLNEHSFYEMLPEGKYFVYTITTADVIPKYASSSTYFTIVYKKDIKLKKVFSKDAQGITHYKW